MVNVLLQLVVGAMVGGTALMASHGGVTVVVKERINTAGMRFFRDLGRIKARKRRYGDKSSNMNSVALLMGREELLDLELLRNDDSSQQERVIVDILELEAHTGDGLDEPSLPTTNQDGKEDESDNSNINSQQDESVSMLSEEEQSSSLLWLSIQQRVYDVTAGWKFYGPGGPYHGFVGRDATRAFCTGCLLDECLISNTTGLSEQQIMESMRWVEYYELHDKYKFVGLLQNVTGAIDDLVEQALQAEEESGGGLKMTPDMLG
jgi:cytochrome b involved in lipid metabolism